MSNELASYRKCSYSGNVFDDLSNLLKGSLFALGGKG
jgi:hypothetical protein